MIDRCRRSPLSWAVRPLARVSPSGALRVDEVGGPDGVAGVTDRSPALVWPVIVRLAVIATALAGTPPKPATGSCWDVPAWNVASGPTWPGPARVSISRTGGRVLYVACVSPARK